jgi:hypothetical protein
MHEEVYQKAYGHHYSHVADGIDGDSTKTKQAWSGEESSLSEREFTIL